MITQTGTESELIYRQQAIDALGERPHLWTSCDYELGCVNQYDLDKLAIETVPPAQPERERAKWIATTSLQEGQITWRDYKCSNCSHHRSKPMNYCEVCGAKMER